MADFVSLTCPSCKGKLQIGKDLERFACGYCGTEFVVNRGGGIVSLSPVVEGLKRVERGVDRTASELAIARLRKDIDDLAREYGSIGSDSQTNNQMLMYGIFALLAAIGPGLLGGVWQVALCFGLPGVLLVLVAVGAYSDNGRQKREIETKIAAKRSEIIKHEQMLNR